jgi:peptidyl-prolyl cis-trans isomerase SurA
MQPGQISAPMQTPDGYRIVVLVERRLVGVTGTADATVTLHQLVFPVGSKASAAQRKAIQDKASQLADRMRSCADAETVARDENLPLSGSLGQLKLADLPTSVQQAVLQTETGRATPPLQVGQALAVMTVCSKTIPDSRLPDAANIRDQLRMRKVERLAQQYTRDLRQGAYINVRGME